MAREKQWVLASASPRRGEILRRLGLRFQIDPSNEPEPSRRFPETPSRYVIRTADFKAQSVAPRHPDSLIVAADTIVVIDDLILGKPSDRADARSMLRRLSGSRHEVLTGLCLFDTEEQRKWTSCCRSRVHFRRMSASDIEWYLDTKEYKDKAGAYGIQERAALFIDHIEGCYFNIVGFPVAAFAALCRRGKIDLRQAIAKDM